VVIIQLPKSDINNIEILIAEKIWILINIWFCLNIEETLENVRFLELSETHLAIILAIGNVVHSINNTKGIPILKLWGVL
jgi:hypothetical protein